MHLLQGKRKIMKTKIFCIIICILSLICNITPLSICADSETDELINDILSFKMNEAGVDSVQSLIDGKFTSDAGVNSEWYIFALSRDKAEYNYSAYENALISYVNEKNISSASTRLKYALVLASIGSENEYISSVMDNSIGKQGIMSYIFGLHLLNNGYSSNVTDLNEVKSKIISMQLSDGGWAITGNKGDVDVTAMAVQSLTTYYPHESDVKASIDKAIQFLSENQLADGTFSSYGKANLESTAQVLTALSGLGINCKDDERFIKENNIIDAMKLFRLSDGSFSHIINSESNDSATVEALYSFVAYSGMLNGESPLYIFNKPDIHNFEIPIQTETQPVVQQETTSTTALITATSSELQSTFVTQATETTTILTTKIRTVLEETTYTDISTDTSTFTTEKVVTKISTSDSSKKVGYKPFACVILVSVGAITCIVLFAVKKRSYKNYIAVLIAVTAGIIFICVTDFKSGKEYYGKETVKENAVGKVTFSISCKILADKEKNEFIPEDCIILDTSEFEIENGDTVCDILTEACRKNSIQLEKSGGYVTGINYLYEFDYGDLSGWIYSVNGEKSSLGSDEYILSDGDEIEWEYTCEMGNDIGDN